jgi:lambda repressor-like predicted transcriptional regulator
MKKETQKIDPKDIRIELLRAEITQSGIARALGVTPRAIGLVIDGNSTSQRIRKAVASAIGLEAEDIWPGKPRKPGRPKCQDARKLKCICALG